MCCTIPLVCVSSVTLSLLFVFYLEMVCAVLLLDEVVSFL